MSKHTRHVLWLVFLLGLSAFGALFATGRIFIIMGGVGIGFGVVNLVEFLGGD